MDRQANDKYCLTLTCTIQFDIFNCKTLVTVQAIPALLTLCASVCVCSLLAYLDILACPLTC